MSKPILPDVALDAASIGANRRKVLFLSLASILLAALPGQAQNERKSFSPQELDQMLAPIALYSDALLSQVLMASSYPLEIVEAGRWSQANPTLKGDAAVSAVADKSWDVSVKSLTAFPPVLSQLSEHLDWTLKLGDALIGQQQDVAASIQRLRARAADAGNLKSGPEQTVTIETQGSERIIALAPADPEVIYVPNYDPNTIYGSWPDSSYPPTYYPWGGTLLRGLTWGLGFAAAGAMFAGWNWGYGGSGSYTNINVNRATNIDRNFNRNNIGTGDRWQHNVDHRKGVAYRDNATRQQFGQVRPGAEQREQFRGQIQQGPRGDARPGLGGSGGAQGPGGGVRPGAGAGAGQRPSAVQRPAGAGAGAGAGQRPTAAQRPAGAGARGPGNVSGLGGVNRGQQVNREAQRGRAQQQRAATPRTGGGGGRPGGGGGGRPGGGGGGGGRPGGGGGGGGRQGGGGGGGRR